ncbi:MAG: CD1871A family CXXC motif-containing protein [Clostridiales bacterium]|nr:CD1871A family CXXC motif-containing protein [Clostridiales bacterium]MDO5141239.1 CD1871A family CXXC motif-containing protein [Eubacteriales bacterium]
MKSTDKINITMKITRSIKNIRDIRNIRYLMLAAAVISVAVGIALGQPASVLGKAVRVCLECIGIG